MDSTKSQRIVRALEVYYGTGKPLSTYHADARPSPSYAFIPVVLTRDREALYQRINLRVDQMIEQGLQREVEGLLSESNRVDALPLRTIGYREIIQYLRGDHSLDEAIRLIKRNTRRYAKRQLTWFRRFPEYRWLHVGGRDEVYKYCIQLLQ
jgi:tRNA dimethylallyltransferase